MSREAKRGEGGAHVTRRERGTLKPREREKTTAAAGLDIAQLDAVVFDMDGVLTDTARVHAEAWARLFDDVLPDLAEGDATRPFSDDDYRRFVDGRSRLDGVEAFLVSRHIQLDRGTRADPAEAPTAWGLANRKDLLFQKALSQDGVIAFATSVAFVDGIRAAGLRTAVVTASRNRAEVLAAAGLDGRFDAYVDGIDAAALGLPGKPDPAMFVEAARRLGVRPRRAAVVEDAFVGVEAGRRGGFAVVVGVARTGNRDALVAAGADVVVEDLGELALVSGGNW